MANPLDIQQLRAERDASLSRALEAESQVRALDAAIATAQRGGYVREATRLQALRASTSDAAQAARVATSRARAAAWAGLGAWLDQSPEAARRDL